MVFFCFSEFCDNSSRCNYENPLLLENPQSRILFHRVGQSLCRPVGQSNIRQAQCFQMRINFESFEQLEELFFRNVLKKQ